MKKILITGANGQLGADLMDMLSPFYAVKGYGRAQLDITKLDDTINIVRGMKPNIIINCGAYTNVDKAEQERDMAYRVNGLACRNLAVACLETKSQLIHISTDFVYDGKKEEPYIEFDKANPINIYGHSKLMGEEYIRQIYPRHFILRTSWLYGQYGNNFVKTMLKLAKENEILRVVDDQKGTPTYTKDLVRVIRLLMETEAYGTYHASNNGACTWFEFASQIFSLYQINKKILSVTTEELKRSARRPQNSVMRNYLLELDFGYHLDNWVDALKRFVKE
ncbi:dTDP-4-dehydrorhamnose reductase [Anaerosolibacter carboniphilus]|uniref:dTDP-4-dehydrorhamnose reductase n=1 Tax=Anaerosolibacter carboniphilus TaxID=1417629 RepID=A0A841L223_9FIRM|nr:dTDP-4-dehydrorhamnose reductase [Anaerosolibacter carboniphilus]MBB6216439.1 dTDP-4-dehydrorhamnose reductase [Anaerosolibacter carboniphilus]